MIYQETKQTLVAGLKMADKNTYSGLVQVDTYAQRKNYAKGLVDLSLLTANANQLAKQYREAGEFNFACFLLTASMGFQVLHFDL